MKKGFLIILSAVLLITSFLFTACDSWMQDDDFYSDIENDVKVANAQQISVYVRYALTRQGKTDPDGTAVFKVEIPHEISATTEPEFGFVRWAAFSTEFLATGDNQSQNKDIYYIDDEDYNERIAPNEITAPAVVFEDASQPDTKVTINVARNDIFLVPIVAQRPAVSLTIPAKGQSNVVRNMSVRINFSKPMDPDSFKNEAGEFDKITIEQGTQAFGADGDIEIISDDITNRFETPVFSKNKKMITLKFKPTEINEGYTANSIVSVTISKDVKDAYGFTMSEDDKVSFSIGSFMDTLAPRITQLNGWTTLNANAASFKTFEGMYKDAATHDLAGTSMKDWQLSGSDIGADDAPTANLDSAFYDPFAPLQSSSETGYRVTDSLYIRVYAEDIAASGSGNDVADKLAEADVAMIGARATLMYAADGSAPSSPVVSDVSSFNYLPQNKTSDIEGSYQTIINSINNVVTPAGENPVYSANTGFLFKYDLKSMPDGLIRIDVFGVDMVQNSGLTEGGIYSAEYGNGYASLFVVKDTTPPDALANSTYVIPDVSQATAARYFNNTAGNSHNRSKIKINGDTSSIVDSGHERLRSKHNNIKWVAKLTSDTSWKNTVSASAWTSVTNALGGDSNPSYFAAPAVQGQIPFTYALMDDLGNISNVVAISPANPVYYDSVIPSVGTLNWTPESGSTAGIAKANILTEQTLVIPVTEATSGIKELEFTITRDNGNVSSAPLSAPAFTLDGTSISYTKSGKTLTFSSPVTGSPNITVKGLTLTDTNIGESENYTVAVKVKDAADNISIIKNTLISIDSVEPEIKKLYIPGITGTAEISSTGTVGTETKYWINNTSTSSSIPRTYIDITFEETGSGAKVFDFADSTVKLTTDSALYVNYGTASQRQISATVNTDNKTLTVNSHADAGAYLAKKDNSSNALPVTVRITNIELASSSTDSKAAVIIRDTATNVSGLFKTIVSDNNLQLTPNADGYSCFRYDYVTPSAASPSLTDRNSVEVESTETSATGKTAAESGYTNDAYIDASVTLYPRTSGIASLTISGDAVFDANTKLYIGSNEIFYSRSADGKTASFQKSATDSGSAVITASSSVSLRIEDLKLTAGEGTNRVSFYPKGFGGLYNSSISSSSIVLDTTPPEWDGSGIYGIGDSSYHNSVYPHSSSSNAVAGLTNVDPARTNDIYFYFNDGRPDEDSTYNLNIKAKTVETNKRSDAILFTIGSSSFTKGDGDTFYGKGFGKYTAVARDKAGNKSTVKTFYIVKDESFANDASELTAIDNYMTIVMPDSSARVFANTGTKTHQYSDFNYLESTNTDNCPMITRDYIIKQASDPYKIKIKLASGTASSDKQVDGKTAVPTAGNTAYNRLKATTSSAPLEYYSVSHWYAQFSSTSGGLENNRFEPFNPDNIPGTKKLSWHKYQTSSSDYTDTDIKSRVDAAGNIEIEIPRTASCAPLSILLKDACGNITWRLIRPVSFNTDEGSYTNNYSVAWIVDKEVGVYNEVGDGVHLNGTAEISSGGYGNYSDVAFYNNTVTLNIHHLTESCRFVTDGDNQPKFLTYSTSPSFVYTLKSRIIAWTASGKPGRDAFGSDDGSKPASTPAASDWCFVQQATNGGYPIFNVTNSFPMPNINDCYKLFLLLEDTVGNYEIRQIRRASDNSIVVSTSDPSSTEKPYWLYDATGPTVSDFNYYKINQVADGSNTYNYYSNKSYVTYNIQDSGSGVWNAGKGETSYPGWNSISQRQSISNYQVNLSDYASLRSDNTLIISRSTIYDYAGNNKTSDLVLENNSNNKWRKLTSAPTLRATNAAVAVNTTLLADENDNLTGNTETHSDTSGQELLLTAKWGVTNITIKLYANQSGTETGDTGILGWVVTKQPITSFADFYTSSDVSSNVTWDSTNKYWKYEYIKNPSDWGTAWHDLASFKENYYYPVNKAGLICQTPVKVKFKTNKKPTITNGTSASGYDYTDNGTIGKINADYLKNDAPSTPHLIKVSGTGTSAINYTKYGASVTFTTTEDPTKYRFVYSGTDGVLGTNNGTNDDTYGSWTTLSGSGPSYTISLGSDAVGTALGIQLARGNEEDSDVYPLYGPGFTGHAGSNNWVYDSVTPGIAFANTNPIKSGSASGSAAATFSGDETGTKYIQAANASISFVLSNNGSTDHYQWKTNTGSGWSDWTDILSTYLNINDEQLTFPAPESKTQYMFRVIDVAGNISTEMPSAGTSPVRLQRDQWAPEAAGGLTYELRNGTTKVSTEGMNIPYNNAGTVDEDTRVISYSKTSTNTSYYIDRIWINLSNVTDKRNSSGNVALDGIERSGIKQFDVYEDGYCIATLDKDSTEYEITGLNSKQENQVYEYKIKVVDNLDQEKTLITFNTNADGQAPDLGLLTGDSLVQKATDAQGAGATDWLPKNASTTYYLNSAYTIINLKKTATDVFKYQVTTDGGSSWDDITPQVDTSTSPHSVKYIFATPASATYQFRAIDGVGNDSTPTTAITIQKDTTAPTNTVTWAFKKDNGADAIGNDFYNITVDGTAIKSITYNGNKMNKFEFNVSSIASASDTSGIRRYWLKIGDTKFDSLTTSSPAFDSSSKTWAPGIATTGSEEVSYQIWAEDWAGNTTDVKEFKLTNDVETPAISFADSDIVQTKAGDETAVNAISIGEDSNKVYYLNKAKAVINLKTSSTDIKDYQVIIGDADPAPITSSSGLSTSSLSYTFAAPTTPTTYSFKVIDNVGNESSATGTVKLVLDNTPPAFKEGVSALSYAVQKEDGNAATSATSVSDANPVPDYVLSTEETTTTITYNPAVVKTISFNALANELSEYATDGADSGYAKLYYKSSSGSAHYMGGSASNVITLENNWNKTYSIYAEDKVGNQSAALMTFKFVADSTGPVPADSINNHNDKLNNVAINKLHSYSHNYPSEDGNIPYATLKKVYHPSTPNNGHAKVNYYKQGTTIKYAASLIPGAVQYQIVQSVNADDGYASVDAVDENWLPVTKEGDDFVFALPNAASTYATTPYTRLAFFFMDSVGNKTGPYYLGNNVSGQYGIQWWILDSAITSSDIRISNATWQTPNQYNDTTTYYGVKIKLPVGTVVHKIEGGDSNVTISNVKFMEANATINDNNSIDYIYQTYNESDPGIEMNITVKKEVTNSSDVKIKINGVEQGVFVPIQINPNINRVGGSRIIRGGVAVPVSDSDSDESTGSRFVQFINNVQDTFTPASEVSLDNSVTEKPAKKAKKTAKKAKKQAKKASGKVVSTGSTVEKPVMAVEAAEIIEQTLTSNVPEVAVAGESVVSEIAGVAEKVNAAEQVVSIRPTGYSTTAEASSTTAEAEATTADAGDAADVAEKKTPSKSASIVIMLAILSSFSAVWYLQRNRKK